MSEELFWRRFEARVEESRRLKQGGLSPRLGVIVRPLGLNFFRVGLLIALGPTLIVYWLARQQALSLGVKLFYGGFK